MKSFVMAGVLAIASLSLASAKTYEISLSGPAKAGSVQLKPGQYRVKVDGNNATFFNSDGSKPTTVQVKVVNGEKKFETTTVDATKEGEAEVIKDIQLGGSKTTIEF